MNLLFYFSLRNSISKKFTFLAFYTIKNCEMKILQQFKIVWDKQTSIFNMGNIALLVLSLFANISFAQTALYFDLPDETVYEGDTVRLSLKTENFNEIVSVQYSINWDANIIKYVDYEQVTLENVAIGAVMADSGELRLSWFGIIGDPVSLPDNSTTIDLLFEAVGNVGDSTHVAMTGEPLEIQIYRDSSGINVPVNLDADHGSVLINSPEEFVVNADITNIDCYEESTGAIALEITGLPENSIFEWSGPDEFTSSEVDLDNLSSGFYDLTIFNEAGVTIYSDSYLVVQPNTEIIINAVEVQNSGCNEDTGAAVFTVQGGSDPYQYSIGDGYQENPEFSDLAPGDYTINIVDDLGCTISQPFNIQASDLPEIELGEDVELCEGENLDLDAGAQSSYLWSTGSEASSITVNSENTYSVTVTSASDCTAVDEVTVVVIPEINLVVETDSLYICPNTSIELTVDGGPNYYWVDNNETLEQTDIPHPLASPNEDTEYTVVSVNDCYSDTASVFVGVHEVLSSAGQDTCIALGTAAQLQATGGIKYEWLVTEYPVSSYIIANPTTTPKDSTQYVAIITDENQCVKIDTVNVAVASDPLAAITAINLITPNDDGKNDVLEFVGAEKFPSNALKVYNRWGDLIYQKVNYQKDDERFDGTYKGEQVPAGTYYYILSFQNEDLKQSLTIVRE